MNESLLRRIQQAITQEAAHFDMSMWIAGTPDELFNEGKVEEIPSALAPDCETTMCIAGWAAFLERRHVDDSPWIEDRARDVLGLFGGEANRLFYVAAWPEPYATDYATATTPEARASVAVARIERFIESGGTA